MKLVIQFYEKGLDHNHKFAFNNKKHFRAHNHNWFPRWILVAGKHATTKGQLGMHIEKNICI